MESAQNVRESKTIKRVHKAVLPPYLITTREGVLETKVEKGFFEVVPDDGKPELFDNPYLGPEQVVYKV